MADNTQFGNPKALQFGDRISPGGGSSGDSGHCGQCEAMLADALDGSLTPAAQATFDAHIALCRPCSSMLADARRGAAWLEMLRDPRPEPPAGLLERILAQTTAQTAAHTAAQIGTQLGAQTAAHTLPHAAPALLGYAPGQPGAWAPTADPTAAFSPASPVRGHVLPFRTRVATAVRGNFFGHAMMQPRLAMTAAMAFFSITLTLNLTGVRLTELRPADLKPSSLKRGFYTANARVVQYYEGLRVVYELEARAHELQRSSDSDPAPDSGDKPAAPQQERKQDQPADPKSDPERPRPRKPGPGTSRREPLFPEKRMVASLFDPNFDPEKFTAAHSPVHPSVPNNGEVTPRGDLA